MQPSSIMYTCDASPFKKQDFKVFVKEVNVGELKEQYINCKLLESQERYYLS